MCLFFFVLIAKKNIKHHPFILVNDTCKSGKKSRIVMKTLKRRDHNILLQKAQYIISNSKNITAFYERQHSPSERLCLLCGLIPFVLHAILKLTRADVHLEQTLPSLTVCVRMYPRCVPGACQHHRDTRLTLSF